MYVAYDIVCHDIKSKSVDQKENLNLTNCSTKLCLMAY